MRIQNNISPKNAISAHSLRAYIFSNIRSVLLCYGQVWFIMSEGPEVLEKKGHLSPIPPDLADQSKHKEAISTLVESLEQMTSSDLTIFLKLASVRTSFFNVYGN